MNDKLMYNTEVYELLQGGELIKPGYEYYNPYLNRWLPVEPDTLFNEFNSDESKPVRRRKVCPWCKHDDKVRVVIEEWAHPDEEKRITMFECTRCGADFNIADEVTNEFLLTDKD